MNLITKASDTEKTIFLKGKAEKLQQVYEDYSKRKIADDLTWLSKSIKCTIHMQKTDLFNYVL